MSQLVHFVGFQKSGSNGCLNIHLKHVAIHFFLKKHLIEYHKKGIKCPICHLILDMPLLMAQKHIKNAVKTHTKVCTIDNCSMFFRSQRDLKIKLAM